MYKSLGDRIKSYEQCYDYVITNRTPVIIRCDGRGFSKWTKKQKLNKPFDDSLSQVMAKTMLKASEKIEGCVFGFTQSDEITFVLRNDQSKESEPWFGNRLQKICSITASIVTCYFNKYFCGPDAFFDARVFIVPNIYEASNCLIWRQNDATKNSISTSCYYEVGKIVGKKTARKLMHKLGQKRQCDLLYERANINWNDYPIKYKRGSACYKVLKESNYGVTRSSMILDDEIPIFTKEKEWLISKLGF